MTNCFNCDNPGQEMYGYHICDQCKQELRLFSDATILKHMSVNPQGYISELTCRLEVAESEYIKSKIKLKYTIDRAKAMLNEQ